MKILRVIFYCALCVGLGSVVGMAHAANKPAPTAKAESATTASAPQGAAPYTLSFPKPPTGGKDFVTAADTAATFTVKVTDAKTKKAVSGAAVQWSIQSVDASANPAVASSHKQAFNGLTLGDSPKIMDPVMGRQLEDEVIQASPTVRSTTNAKGEASITLRDVVGERTVTLLATATTTDGADGTASQGVKFGKGPLSKLTIPKQGLVRQRWFAAYQVCNGVRYPHDALPWVIRSPEDRKHREYIWVEKGTHIGGKKMPSIDELQTVSSVQGNGAAQAAGWPGADWYWSGIITGSQGVEISYVIMSTSFQSELGEFANCYVTCRR